MESRRHNHAAGFHALDRFRFRARMVAIGSTMDHTRLLRRNLEHLRASRKPHLAGRSETGHDKREDCHR